jgi:hypothetical protein
MLLARILFLTFLAVAANPSSAQQPDESNRQIDQVLSQIQAALSKAQTEAAASNLPALHSVELELKSEFTTSGSGELNLYVITVGGAVEGESVQRVLLTMTPPPPFSERPIAGNDITETLSSAIISAAKGVALAQKRKPPLKLSKLEVEIKFAVKSSGTGGLKLEIIPITASLKGEVKSNAVQTAKVTFQADEK